MASDIWLRTILIVRKETRCRHIGYSYRLTARVLLYAPSHRQDNTYHDLCYTSRGALAGNKMEMDLGPMISAGLLYHWAPLCPAHKTELYYSHLQTAQYSLVIGLLLGVVFPGAVQSVQSAESGLRPDTESTYVTSGGNPQQIQTGHVDQSDTCKTRHVTSRRLNIQF